MLTLLLQTTLIWGTALLFYHLVLRKTTFFTWNRWFLLTMLVSGIAVPCLMATGWWSSSEPADESIPSGLLPAIQVGLKQVNQQIWLEGVWIRFSLILIYLLGVAVMLWRLIVGLVGIFRLVRAAQRVQLTDGTVLLTSEKIELPASFLSWIFWPAAAPIRLDGESDAILRHEQAHQRGWHSADVLLIEILLVFFWCHPLVYLFKDALRSVHEYIADRAAARTTTRKQYGLLLIRHAQSGKVPALTHHFFQSPLKQRLIMLTQHQSGLGHSLRYLLLIPILAVLFLFCQTTKDDFLAEPTAAKQSKDVLNLDDLDVQPEFPGGIPAMMQYLGSNVKYPESAQKAKTQGTAVIKFIVGKDGVIEEANIAKDVENGCGAEALRVVGSMPKWTPGQKDGKPVRVSYALPIKFKLD
jgi:TonB family protein